ncbi:MAG: ABC transporter permease subunit [Eubacteriales bacterium]
MNILKMEYHSIRNAVAIWTISIIGTFLLFMMGIFPIFEENTQVLVDMLVNMPSAYMEAFGMEIDSFTEFPQFYGFTYLYLAIMGSIMASLITLKVFCKEKQNKAEEFLFTKPVSRKRIFGYKLLAVVSMLAISNVVYIPVSIYYLLEQDVTDSVVLASNSLLFLEIFCMCLCIFLSVFVRKIRSSASYATGIGFLFFTIQSVVSIMENEYLLYISPFAYYQPTTLWKEGHYDQSLVGCSIIVMSLFVGFSFWKYTTSDIESV